MSFTLVKFTLDSSKNEEASLPVGLPFLVHDDTQAIDVPTFRFLTARHASIARLVPNTALAEAEDLKDWLTFLEHFELEWDHVERRHIEQYRDLMLTLVSPRTHERYSLSTVKRRLNTILSFYRFSNARKFCDVALGDEPVPVKAPQDRNMLAHAAGKPRTRPGNDLMDLGNRSADDAVRAFTKPQYQAIVDELGPLPPETGKSPRPTRDRLWAQMCVMTGMRPDEPSKIATESILALTPPNPQDPYGVTLLKIRGKGSKLRKVEIPNLLLGWLRWYIENERKEALKAARKKGFLGPQEDPGNLFLNGVDARANLGRPATYATFASNFNRALKRAHAKHEALGLMQPRTKTNPENAQKYSKTEAAFSPHCLRHTFAIWTYLAEKRAGNAEPWKIIQARLGHAHLATTTDIYLRLAGDFEAVLSDRIGSHVARILNEEG